MTGPTLQKRSVIGNTNLNKTGVIITDRKDINLMR